MYTKNAPDIMFGAFYVSKMCSFLVSARKERKEDAIGEALSAALPRVKSALSYVPHPARTR